MVMAAMPALADSVPGAVAPPLDARVFGRAAYVALLLLAMGTAWFLLLVPVSASLVGSLRRALALFAAGGLLAGMLNSPPPNAVAVVGFVALLIGSWRGYRGVLLGGALALAVSRALIGHPASLDPGVLLVPLMILHVSCAAYWVGSLWPLHRLLGSETPVVAAPAVARFSRIALAAVGALALVGIITAAIHLKSPQALSQTWYGQLVIMKLTWFTVLMGIAAYHKRRLTPRLAMGDAGAATRMRWGIRVEAVILVIVILLSTLLAITPPGALPRKSASIAEQSLITWRSEGHAHPA
jgi:xanthosine utilization system XapX-like protein